MFSASFFASGEPYPMGSFQGRLVKGKAIAVPVKDHLRKRWQRAVRLAASLHAPDEPIDARFRVVVVFHLTARWMRRDGDKLLRNTLDALTKIIYVDDSRVFRGSFEKVDALDGPTGATITVEELPC